MNYLYFDIECCDGNHMCSFGYVLTDENFKILKKDDIIINPQWRFKLGRAGFDPRINLAYSEETFKKQPPFPYFYKKIKNLLESQDQILLGHSITSDIKFLKNACKRYGLPILELEIYDTQDFYYQLNKKYKSRSLDNIIKDLKINVLDLQKHKSCDDAELSMLVTKEICNQLQIKINDLLNLCDKSKRDGSLNNLTENGLKKRFSKDLKYISDKYPERKKWKSICFSDTIKETNYELRIDLIKNIFDKGYNYTSKVSECDYFVTGKIYGEKDLICDCCIEDEHKNITKITIDQLSKMLNININENGEYIKEESQNNNSLFYEAFMKSLKNKNITYEEWENQF